jgi:hypothetical protein
MDDENTLCCLMLRTHFFALDVPILHWAVITEVLLDQQEDMQCVHVTFPRGIRDSTGLSSTRVSVVPRNGLEARLVTGMSGNANEVLKGPWDHIRERENKCHTENSSRRCRLRF